MAEFDYCESGAWDEILRAIQADADVAGRIEWFVASVHSTSRRARQHAGRSAQEAAASAEIPGAD